MKKNNSNNAKKKFNKALRRGKNSGDLRLIEAGKLQEIFKEHKKWLESDKLDGARADLSFADLNGSDLSGLDLRYAKITCAGLNGADLHGANLQDANLSHSQLEGAKLKDANIKRANFYGASLKDANLESIEFLGHEFAGADLTGSTPFKEDYDSNILETIEQISINARKIFAVLLSTCGYTLLTFITTSDLNILLNRGSFALPFIGSEIDILKFTLIVPFVLIATFIYLHYYLNRLWTALALLPAKFPDGLV